MNPLERRWQERWAERPAREGRTVRWEEAVTLPASATQTWALLNDLDLAATLSPDLVTRAYALAGSPDGTGQHRCFVQPDGTTLVLRVGEHVPDRRLTASVVSPPPQLATTTTYDLSEGPYGCRLVVGVEVDVPAGVLLDGAAETRWRSQARDHLTRVAAALEVGPPPQEPDTWSVALDESFVAAAAVHERSGAERAADARRVSAAHARVQPWRAPAGARARTRQRRPLGSLAFAAVVLAVAVAGLLGKLPADLGTGAVEAASGDGSPSVPQPPDAQSTRLLPSPSAPPGSGGWTALGTDGDRPVGFDPCRPVHWVMRSEGAPAAAGGLLTEAFARLSEATGLVFVHDGATDEAYDDDRELVQPARYGDRYAPVLVVWSDEQRTAGLRGRVGGFAGPLGVDPDGSGRRYVSGVVVLDAPQLTDLRSRPAQLGVVLHELGHLAGLGHVQDQADSMYASSGPATSYTAGALRGLAEVGAGPCFP